MSLKVVQLHCLRCDVNLSIEMDELDEIDRCPCCGADMCEIQLSKQGKMTAKDIV